MPVYNFISLLRTSEHSQGLRTIESAENTDNIKEIILKNFSFELNGRVLKVNV